MTIKTKTKRYDVLGVMLDAMLMTEAADAIMMRCNQKGAVYVAKPYVEFLDAAQRDDEIKRLLNHSWLSLPDSVSMQWATAYLYGGKPGILRAFGLAASIVLSPDRMRQIIPERYSGASFSWLLLERAAQAGKSVYLMGSPVDSSIELTAQVIKRRLPDIKIVGTRAGELGGKSRNELLDSLKQKHNIEKELVKELRRLKPDIILVGMGFPLQEVLMDRLAPQLLRGVLVGEGGTFDYDSFGGKKQRAPVWMRDLGLEWLWRLALEPGRWRRQLAIPRFMWAVYRQPKR